MRLSLIQSDVIAVDTIRECERRETPVCTISIGTNRESIDSACRKLNTDFKPFRGHQRREEERVLL